MKNTVHGKGQTMKIAHALLLTPLLASAQTLTLQQGLQEALTKGPEAELIRNSVDSANEVVTEVRKVAWPSISGYANAGLGREPSMLGGLAAGFGALGQSISDLDRRVAAQETAAGGAPQHGGTTGPLAALSALQTDPDSPTWAVGYGVQASQALFTFGKVTTALHMASTQNRITNLKVKTDRTKVQTDFLSLWIGTSLAQRKVGTIESSIKRQTEIVAFLERSFAGGSGAKAQVLMARSQMLRLQPDLLSARRDAMTMRHMLNRTLGRPSEDSTPLDTAGLVELEGRQAPSRADLLQQAMENRNDLRSVKEVLGLQQDLISIYRANYLPNIGLKAKLGVTSTDLDMGTAFKGATNIRDNYDWQVGLGMQWNIFDGFEQSAKAGQTRAAVHALEIRQNDLRRFVETEVDKALLDRQAADSSLASAREGLAAATEARKLYDDSFRQGSGTLSDVLGAEDNQRLAEMGVAAAQLERTRASAQLALVRGQDLIALPEAP